MDMNVSTKYLIKPNAQKMDNSAQNGVSKPTKLKVFYTNDWHGQSDNLGSTYGAALDFNSSAQGQSFDTLRLMAGDSWSGADTKKNNMILNIMNFLRFDACAVGNHELDAGVNALVEATNKSKGTQFVSANLTPENGQTLGNVKKSAIKEINGNKYGIIGLSPLDLKTVLNTDKSKGIDVKNLEETIEAAQEEINNLRSQGVNKIILLSHIGKEFDEKIAKELEGIDVIVGGHSHDKIENITQGENLIRSKSGEPVVILQAGENAQNYGIFEAEFDEKGILTKVSNKLIEGDKKKNSVIEAIKNDELGPSPHVGTLKEITPMPANRRITPVPWTAALADSMKSELGVEVALINSANTRKVPQAGNLTERDIQESTPMKNQLYKTTMSEAQLTQAVKNAAYRSMGSVDSYPGLLQCSGIKYTIDNNGILLEMSITDKNGKDNKVDLNNPSETKTYTVALDSFLANGKEYPEMVPKSPIEVFDFDKDTTMINYLNKMPNKEDLKITDDGRLKIVQTSQPQRQYSSTRNI